MAKIESLDLSVITQKKIKIKQLLKHYRFNFFNRKKNFY